MEILLLMNQRKRKSACILKSPQSCPTLHDPMDCSPPELTKDLTAAQNNYWLFRLVERGIITQTQLNNHVNQTLKKNGKDPTHISEGGAAWVARYVASAMKDAGILAEYITLE